MEGFRIYLYDKNGNIIGIFLAPSQKKFEADKLKYCSEYREGENFISYSEIKNPIIENGKIKTVELSEFEYIDNNKIKINRDKKIENIKEKLNALKVQHSEKEFIFKEKYKQKNRELDKNNLGNITTMLLATKQTDFKNWKFKDLDDKDIYVDLTIQDMLLIAKMMQEQTTKAMMTETALKVKIETLSDEELKNFDSEKEFEKEWEK